MKKPFFSRLWTKIILGVVLLAILGGAIYLIQNRNNTPEDETPALQTTKVIKGDLVISANGTGSVYPEAQVQLGFKNSGVIAEIYVVPNQKVSEGG